MGFWVAMTKNGRGRGWLSPPRVTDRSCIASSSADWVLGVARLISSARSRLAKTGPSWNTNSSRWSTLVPRMSAGMRSGVNWIRPNSTSRTVPSVARSLVLPRPGTHSRRTWPSHNAPMRTVSTRSRWPTMIFPTSARTAAMDSANCWGVISSFMGSSWLEIGEVVADHVPHRWRHHQRIEGLQSPLLVIGEPVRARDERQVLHPASPICEALDFAGVVAASELHPLPFPEGVPDRIEDPRPVGCHLGIVVTRPAGRHTSASGPAPLLSALLAAGSLTASSPSSALALSLALALTLSLALTLALTLTLALALTLSLSLTSALALALSSALAFALSGETALGVAELARG